MRHTSVTARTLIPSLLALMTPVMAEQNAQLTWEGYVRGSAVLYVQADRVDAQGRDTGSVDKPRITLREPLPASRQQVSAKLRSGRGQVEIVEQPVAENEYTAVVRVDNPGKDHEHYRIDVFWSAKR